MVRGTSYICAASIRAIRRTLGKKVDERHTEVQRSQHLTPGDVRVFGQSYVANTSSVGGRAAYPDEPADHRHIEFAKVWDNFMKKTYSKSSKTTEVLLWTSPLIAQSNSVSLLLADDAERQWGAKSVHHYSLCREHDKEVLVEFRDTTLTCLDPEDIETLTRLHKFQESSLPTPNPSSRAWRAECMTAQINQICSVREAIADDGSVQFVNRWKLMWLPQRDLRCTASWLQRQLRKSDKGTRRSKRLQRGHNDRTEKMRAINKLVRSMNRLVLR